MSSKTLLLKKTSDINSTLTSDDLERYTADCLKRYCKENEIQSATTKSNIIINIIKHFNENNEEEKEEKEEEEEEEEKEETITTTKIQPKSILKKLATTENKENNVNSINEIINKVDNLKIVSKDNKPLPLQTRKSSSSTSSQKQPSTAATRNRQVTFNPINQIGFVERKERNTIKYYINTNQNSPIKDESPLKITNNQSYSIFTCDIEEEEEFDTETMSTLELKEACERNGLSSSGSKNAIKNRLEQFIINTLNNTETDTNKEDSPDWMRWTPLKAKYNKSKPTENDEDSNDGDTTSAKTKTIKSKPKPTKKLNSNSTPTRNSNNIKKNKNEEYDEDDDDLELNNSDSDDDSSNNKIMNSQQLFNAFLDVSIVSKRSIDKKK